MYSPFLTTPVPRCSWEYFNIILTFNHVGGIFYSTIKDYSKFHTSETLNITVGFLYNNVYMVPLVNVLRSTFVINMDSFFSTFVEFPGGCLTYFTYKGMLHYNISLLTLDVSVRSHPWLQFIWQFLFFDSVVSPTHTYSYIYGKCIPDFRLFCYNIFYITPFCRFRIRIN